MFLIRKKELQAALRIMTMPDKLTMIDDGLQAMQHVYLSEGPEKAVFNLVALIAYLTDAESGSVGG